MHSPPPSANTPGGSSTKSLQSIEGMDGVGEGDRRRSNGFQAAQRYGEVLRRMKAIGGMYLATLHEYRREVQSLSEKRRTERISSGGVFRDDDFNEAMNQIISLIEARNKQLDEAKQSEARADRAYEMLLCGQGGSPTSHISVVYGYISMAEADGYRQEEFERKCGDLVKELNVLSNPEPLAPPPELPPHGKAVPKQSPPRVSTGYLALCSTGPCGTLLGDSRAGGGSADGRKDSWGADIFQPLMGFFSQLACAFQGTPLPPKESGTIRPSPASSEAHNRSRPPKASGSVLTPPRGAAGENRRTSPQGGKKPGRGGGALPPPPSMKYTAVSDVSPPRSPRGGHGGDVGFGQAADRVRNGRLGVYLRHYKERNGQTKLRLYSVQRMGPMHSLGGLRGGEVLVAIGGLLVEDTSPLVVVECLKGVPRTSCTTFWRSDVTQETTEVTVELRVPEPQMAVVLDFGRDDEVIGEYFV